MPIMRTMEEFSQLDEQEQSDLLPDEFVDDPRYFIIKYGELNYFQFYDMTMVHESCLIKLTDGSRLKYSNERSMYAPRFPNDN